MTFRYYGSGVQQGPAENPFAIQQPQQQQSPLGGLGGFANMMGGEGGIGGMFGGGSAGAGGAAAPAPAAGGASAGGSSAAGGLSAAGPWALLAAVIIANESEAEKAGRRADDRGERAQDMLTGKVLEQDMDYYGDKVGGIGGEAIKGIGQLGNPEGVFNLLKKGSLLRKLF